MVKQRAHETRDLLDQVLGRFQSLKRPTGNLRIAGVLQVEAATLLGRHSAAAVERVRHADRARDRRPTRGIDDERLLFAVGPPLGAVKREREQVAVAGEAEAELTL